MVSRNNSPLVFVSVNHDSAVHHTTIARYFVVPKLHLNALSFGSTHSPVSPIQKDNTKRRKKYVFHATTSDFTFQKTCAVSGSIPKRKLHAKTQYIAFSFQTNGTSFRR